MPYHYEDVENSDEGENWAEITRKVQEQEVSALRILIGFAGLALWWLFREQLSGVVWFKWTTFAFGLITIPQLFCFFGKVTEVTFKPTQLGFQRGHRGSWTDVIFSSYLGFWGYILGWALNLAFLFTGF